MKTVKRTGIALALALLLTAPAALADFANVQSNMKAGKWAEAAAELQELIDTSGDWPDGHYLLGTCYLQLRKYDQAVSEFDKAIELNPDRFDYHFRLALTWFTKKDYKQTINVLNKAEKLATGPAQQAALAKYRGLGYAYTGNSQAAVANLKKAQPEKDATVAGVLGKACYQTGDYPCAITNLERAATKNSKDFELHHLLGRSYLISAIKESNEARKKQFYQGAVTWAGKALALNASSREAKATLAKADLGAGLFQDAERLFLDLMRNEPRECTHYLDLITTLREMERWDGVIEMAGKVTGGSATCDQDEKKLAWAQAGYAWLGKEEENQPRDERRRYLNEAKAASKTAMDMGAGSFAKANYDTAVENLARMDSNIQEEQRAAAEERQQCIECLKVFDFQQKTVAFLKETKQPDADGDGIADTADDCPDTPPWTLVDNKGCTDTSPAATECNKFLAKKDCQELHGQE
jgi:tetratricopeptide (TPR) repeat protein